MSRSFLRLKLVPLAVASLLGGITLGASAAPLTFGNITLDASYALAGGALVDGMIDPNTSIYPAADGADMYLSTGNGANSVFFHTYGITGTYTSFGARVSAEGEFQASTSTKLSMTFKNTGATAQLFNFSFNVADGEVGVWGTGSGNAALALSVRKNGTELAGSQTSITQAGGVTNCANQGLGVLASYINCASADAHNVAGGASSFDLSFGLIGAGEEFTLDYDIIATISGNLSQGMQEQWVCDGYGGYGAQPQLARNALNDNGYGESGSSCSYQMVEVPGGAVARSGDPFSLNDASFAFTFAAPAVTDVPEPGSLALVGLAAAGLAAASRRRKKSKHQA